jgi:hypothetical protein
MGTRVCIIEHLPCLSATCHIAGIICSRQLEWYDVNGDDESLALARVE